MYLYGEHVTAEAAHDGACREPNLTPGATDLWAAQKQKPTSKCQPSKVVENSFAWHHALCYTKLISCKCHSCKFGEEQEAALLSQTTPGALGTPGRQKWLSVNFPACLLVSVTHVHPSPAQTVARACGTASSSGLRSTSVTAQYMNKCNRKPRSD